jgi:hypothetical protein
VALSGWRGSWKLSEMARQDHHEQSLANWDNEGGAMSSKREIPDSNARRVTRIRQRETPMNYVPVFIPALLILALIVVTIYRPGPANDGVLLQKASIVCETPPCK